MAVRSFVRGLALGAGAMYLFDPVAGERRREQIRQGFLGLWHSGEEAVENVRTETRNLVRGTATPTTGACAAALGCCLTLKGLTHGGLGSMLLGGLGVGLLARGLSQYQSQAPTCDWYGHIVSAEAATDPASMEPAGF